MDLIDREQAIAKIEDLNAISFYELNEHSKEAYSEIMAAIKNVPSAEKTELVRCKDCKHWNGETHGCTRNPSVEPWFESDYCNYGARMED